MINIPHKLKEKIQDRILVRQTDNYAEFFSPVHSLYIRLNENCMLSSEKIETDIESFTDQETPLYNESFRMYQQAFLKPPPVFTRMNLELTRSCSLHCPHCFIENSDCPEKSLFDIELISRLIKYSPSEISLTGGEIFLMECNISQYTHGNVWNHEPRRKRRLLMHRKEILRLDQKIKEKGLTIIPLRIYFNDKGKAKVEISLAKGKRLFDKREDIAKRDVERRMRQRTDL